LKEISELLPNNTVEPQKMI